MLLKSVLRIAFINIHIIASQTSIRALIPQWAQAGCSNSLLARIDDPKTTQLIID